MNESNLRYVKTYFEGNIQTHKHIRYKNASKVLTLEKDFVEFPHEHILSFYSFLILTFLNIGIQKFLSVRNIIWYAHETHINFHDSLKIDSELEILFNNPLIFHIMKPQIRNFEYIVFVKMFVLWKSLEWMNWTIFPNFPE